MLSSQKLIKVTKIIVKKSKVINEKNKTI